MSTTSQTQPHAAVSTDRLAALLHSTPATTARPWPVVVLTALGAWLAAVPLLIGVSILLGDMLLDQGPASLVLGALFIVGATVVLRMHKIPIFLEQLAFPALLVGLGLASIWIYHHTTPAQTSLAMAVLVTLIAVAIHQPWLRLLLGAAAALLIAHACTRLAHAYGLSSDGFLTSWVSNLVILALWLATLLWQACGLRNRPHLCAALESFACGWALAILLAQSPVYNLAIGEQHPLLHPAWPFISAALALAAALVCARAWPMVRTLPGALVALVLTALAWWVPELGSILLVMAVTASSQRWRIAATAAVAATWVLGQFYYQLTWPLATKALVLACAGITLGLLAWWVQRQPTHTARQAAAHAWSGMARGMVAASALLTLGIVNVSIWQKENIIAHGQPVLVELAPRDPRSLMQGDYMALNWRLPSEVNSIRPLTAQRPQIVAHKDARGIATLLRVHQPEQALAADEFLIELTPKDGRWVLVTDAWFFKEGDAERFERAKYGEFRVNSSGQALLVGVAGANLKRIE